MDYDKRDKLIIFYNRGVQLLGLIKGKESVVRDRDIAYQYNVLRSDVKKTVKDPNFTRRVPSAWCFIPLIHIPVALLIIGTVVVSFDFLFKPTYYLIYIILVVLVVFVFPLLFLWLSENRWYSAGTISDIYKRLHFLLNYIEDYIATNYPADAYRFGRQPGGLREENQWIQHFAELETKLVQKNSEINKLREDLKGQLESLRKRLRTHYKNLQDLEEQKAKQGITPPTLLLRAIEDEQEAIQEISERIRELENKG